MSICNYSFVCCCIHNCSYLLDLPEYLNLHWIYLLSLVCFNDLCYHLKNLRKSLSCCVYSNWRNHISIGLGQDNWSRSRNNKRLALNYAHTWISWIGYSSHLDYFLSLAFLLLWCIDNSSPSNFASLCCFDWSWLVVGYFWYCFDDSGSESRGVVFDFLLVVGDDNSLSCDSADLFGGLALSDKYGRSGLFLWMNLYYFGLLFRWDWDDDCLDLILVILRCHCINSVDEIFSWRDCSHFCTLNWLYSWCFNCIYQLTTNFALNWNYHAWSCTRLARLAWLTWLTWTLTLWSWRLAWCSWWLVWWRL